jgi:hypothetical protein
VCSSDLIMLPWTWSIAYRRFQQGVMIRYGYSRTVGTGTVVRLVSGGIVLAVGYALGTVQGIVVATCAQAFAVICEAIYAGIRVQPVLKAHVRPVQEEDVLSWKGFASYYIPLAMTSLLTLIWQPIGSAAISRMPNAISSLAVWPVLSGLVFITRSACTAYNEVVVAVMDRPNSYRSLMRFTWFLALGTTGLYLLLAATPGALIWFRDISALPADLVPMALLGFWIALPIPTLTALQSLFQGAMINGKQTRGIPESVVLFLVVNVLVAVLGVLWNRVTGLYVGMAGFTIAGIVQTAWLWFRGRGLLGRRRYVESELNEEAALAG